MRAFTLACPGIQVKDGVIEVGESGRGRSLTGVSLPPGAEVAGDKLISCDGPATAALVYIPDQSGFRGSWHLRDARTPQEWDSIIRRLAAHRPPNGSGALAEGHSLDSCAACGAIAPMPTERPFAAQVIADLEWGGGGTRRRAEENWRLRPILQDVAGKHTFLGDDIEGVVTVLEDCSVTSGYSSSQKAAYRVLLHPGVTYAGNESYEEEK